MAQADTVGKSLLDADFPSIHNTNVLTDTLDAAGGWCRIVRESYTEYQIGDMVWFSVSNLELKHPACRHKLLPKYIGPLKVLDIAGHNAVKLDMPKYLAIHPIVSTTQVKL